MKSKELFRIYNLQNLKRNKWTMIFLSLSILITMTVSFILPQIKVSKEHFINEMMEKTGTADLVVVQSFQSDLFEHKLKELEREGLKIEKIKTSPIYMDYDNNKVMLYLLTGYEKMSENEMIISKGLSDKYRLKVGDELSIYGISDETQNIKISEIEKLPIDSFLEAEIFGYIKVKNLEPSFHSGTNMIFISGKEGEELKTELLEIEPGFQYSTIAERKRALFENLEK